MPQQIDWGQIDRILGSKGLETVLGIVGAAAKSKSEADQNDRLLANNASQFRAQLLNNQRNADRSDQFARATAVAGQPLGEAEDYVTRNRIARALLPAMANAPRITPGDSAIAAVMPQGGLDLHGLITPEMLAAIGEDATANAVAQRSQNLINIDPSAAVPNTTAMGLPGDHDALVERYRQNRIADQQSENERVMRLINMALDEDLTGEKQKKKKGGGFLGGLGKVLGIGGGIASMFIPGLQPVGAALLAGGSAAAGAKLNGSSWGQALLSGVTGAATQGAAGKFLPKMPIPVRSTPPYVQYRTPITPRIP